MSKLTDPLDLKFEAANLQLNDGLTSCRSVVNDYRALIRGVGAPDDGSEMDVEEQVGIEPERGRRGGLR